ncbi:putative F-box domain, leucine-rich repeat domain, L domain-containing protein [Medicago truncatula]|uniref:F-box protein interaction domain protein n=1 Tax=Medicago truncatula TaxID=3880 RepID=A0A072TTX1_MEDTR|nr:F-box/kelch-repeat protein At3g06240 [Medicago truncatula]KEH17000.1 F-box protein interaction domain protein [Medicago truncatula]RHN52168.1 putative F-box domain, leucine-rich repeat domain, L domain-containing protein [Medicago truncatula]
MKKKSAAATNAKVHNYISDDISFTILSKLPLKSLNRFRCVRKSWSLLFENQHLMNMIRKNFLCNLNCCSYYDQASLLLKYLDETHKDILYSLSHERFENKVKLDCTNVIDHLYIFRIFGLGSINGIVCVHANCGAIVFWNPATQAIKLIPPSPLELVELPIPGVAKEFVNVEAFTYLHGFGYDSVIDDYKVICLVSFDIQVELVDTFSDSLLEDIYLDELWEIYSLRSNSWRKLDIDMPSSSYCIEGTQVYMDGVCHWLCEENTPAGPCLVSFYLRNEVFCITPIPSDEDDCFKFKASSINLVLLNGSISLIAFHRETTTFDIAILGELGIKESWTKLFTVGPLSCVERPIRVGTKGEIFFQRKDNELAWFDLSTQVIEELGYKARGPYTRISLYKENILAIEGISN